MPVSITLGLWSTLIAYLISIPLGIKKAVNDGSSFDTISSGIIIICYSLPGFLFAIILLVFFAGGSYYQIFPMRGLTSDNWSELTNFGKVLDYLWHIFLPVLASTIGSFATLTLLTKNSFVDEIKKQYVITAKAKGLPKNRVLYGHVLMIDFDHFVGQHLFHHLQPIPNLNHFRIGISFAQQDHLVQIEPIKS